MQERFIWSQEDPWRRERYPLQCSCPEVHGQRSPGELQPRYERRTQSFHFQTTCTGKVIFKEGTHRPSDEAGSKNPEKKSRAPSASHRPPVTVGQRRWEDLAVDAGRWSQSRRVKLQQLGSPAGASHPSPPAPRRAPGSSLSLGTPATTGLLCGSP